MFNFYAAALATSIPLLLALLAALQFLNTGLAAAEDAVRKQRPSGSNVTVDILWGILSQHRALERRGDTLARLSHWSMTAVGFSIFFGVIGFLTEVYPDQSDIDKWITPSLRRLNFIITAVALAAAVLMAWLVAMEGFKRIRER